MAGAVLSTVGALTHSKDLTKIGAVVGLAGGISSLASSGSSAAAATGDLATAGSEALPIGAAGTGTEVATGAAAGAAAPVADTAAGDVAASLNTTDLGNAAGDAASSATATTPSATATAPGVAAPATDASAVPNAFGSVDPNAVLLGQAQQNSGSLFDAAGNTTAGTQPVGTTAQISGAPATQPTNALAPAPTAMTQASAVSKAGEGLSWKDIQSFYDKAGNAVGGVGKWVQNNQVLAKAGLDAIGSAYGPQSEYLNQQQSLMERARANLNNPVKINWNRK